MSGNSSFDIGSAIVNSLTLSINNFSGKFTDYIWDDARVVCYIGMQTSAGIEKIRICTMTVTNAPYQSTAIINLTCEDYMRKFDRDYSDSKLTYPATRLQIVQDACEVCGVTLQTTSFDNGDFVIKERPDDGSLTFRQVIAWVAQMGCQWAKCDAYGRLCLGWYEKTISKTEPDITAKETQGFTPWLYDITITGIQVTEYVKNSSEKETETVAAGSEGYVIEISDNKLIQEGSAKEICEIISNCCVGMKFRPFNTGALTNIAWEAGDSIVISDRNGKTYQSYITTLTLNPGSFEQLECGAQSVSRQNQKQYSLTEQVKSETKKDIKDERTAREKALKDLADRLGESSGVFTTIVEQEDGSNIYYLHNKPKLEDSDMVWKMTAEALAVSTDGGKTWNGGLTIDGDVIARILAAEGINADWIKTGALRVVNTDGEETLYINADTGEVRASPTLFSLSGKSVADIASDAVKNFVDMVYKEDLEKLQNQIDGKVEEYYYAYKPTLDNLPASEWKTDEEKKAHEGDRFLDKSTGQSYRFSKNDKTGEYEWTLIQDADVAEALRKASLAKTTADGKRRVFITTPQPPYDPGDVWMQGPEGDIMVCKIGREEGTYDSADWEKSSKYTDDTKADQALEAIEKLKTLSVVLNNEYQTVSTDADGNYKNFPEVATTVSVYMGSVDVTDKASYTIAKSSGITGSWNLSTKTYTVTGLSADSGYVDISASYSDLKGTRRFTVAKLKAGAAGPAGTGVEVDVTAVEYQVGNSGTVKPTGSWSIDIPNVPAGKYLWTRTSVTYSDGKKTVTYTVSYKSADGKDGKNGVSPTVSISKSGNTTTITITDEKGTHTQTVKDGTDGTPGTPGSDGKTPYFHVKYSNDGGKTFTSNSGETVGSYLGTCTDYNKTDPTTVGAYTWAKIRGEDGDSVSIKSQQITYQASSSGTTIPTGTWSTSVPSLNGGQYLWTRTVVNYSDGTTTTSYSVSYKGGDGEDGGTWTVEVSSNTIKRGEDGVLKPSSITAKAWYQVGKTVSRTAYTGRLYVYTSTNGSTWTQVSKSDAASSITYDASKLASTIYWLKFTLCAAGTNTVIDQQTVQILDDVSSLTGAIMLNKLSGGWQGIYQGDDGKYYIDAEYIRGKAMSAKYLDARNLTVTNDKGVKTLGIDANGNVSIYATSLSIAGSAAASQDYVNNATAKQLADAKAYANSKSGNLLNGTDLTADDRKTYWNITGSITEGQTDPDGGKNAILITGTTGDNFVSAKYENNNPITTAGQYEVRIWLKSTKTLKTGISFNRTIHEVSVTTSWKQYKFSIPITAPATSGENFTIGGFAKLVKGDKLYVYKPEVVYSYTPEDILNMLTNNGAMDGIFMENGQLYVKGAYIKVNDLYSLKATLGGWKINPGSIVSETGDIILRKNGKIGIGNVDLYSTDSGMTIKYGLNVYTSRTADFTSNPREFRLYGLPTNSGRVLTISSNVVGMQASSSKRYKNHIRNMTKEEAEKILSLPVVWFRYKNGYLLEGDSLCGKDVPGFYAEDIAELFPECAAYDEKGRPEDWNYRMLVPVMMKLIQNLYKEVKGK